MMSYLSRDAAPFSDKLWEQIDAAVVSRARMVLTGRRFLPLLGPLGIGVDSIAVDDADGLDEVIADGVITTKGRKYLELPTLFEDFTLLAKDMESSKRAGLPLDLSKAMSAAEACALREDRFIFWGNATLGYDGLMTAPGADRIKRSDWSAGENAYADITAAISMLKGNGIYGGYTLVLSPDLYMQLQRLQPGTGLLEIDRISKLLQGRVCHTPVLGSGAALLLCPDQRNMDLVVGQDMAAAYLEQKDLNHVFRILETVLLRVKRGKAIVVFE